MIKFNKIVNGDIFTRDFRPLAKNNEIKFSSKGMVVIYGPNGTGKTSLIRALSGDNRASVEFEYEGISYSSGEAIFHVINDQNSRNIIAGETKDFLLGDNIKKEFELYNEILKERERLTSEAISILKNKHGVSSSSSPIIDVVEESEFQEFIKDLANIRSKGGKYDVERFINIFSKFTRNDEDGDNEKSSFLKNDYASRESIIRKIEGLDFKKIPHNSSIAEVEENTEAISILNRFQKDQCVVCDTENINREVLIAKKTKNRSVVLDSLGDEIKSFISTIIGITPSNDPFRIKESLMRAIEGGDKKIVQNLISEFSLCKKYIYKEILNDLSVLFAGSTVQSIFEEYKRMLAEKPEITDEDVLYIEEIINNSMNKTLTVERDEQKNLKIRLANKEFLGISRDDLPLSAGEQNFLSLTFEFLKAKNTDKKIVIVDDPISSFDSIYKNKVVYAIIKILSDKKRIILTHNIDMIRLLDGQYSNYYKMYILNNTEGEENGFVQLKNNEQEMLINLKKLLDAFRDNIFDYIIDVELFLLSMIPFMRGYASITNNKTVYEDLTKLMHGYCTDHVDIASIYRKLFNATHDVIPKDGYVISVPEILGKTVDGKIIVDNARYPLLDKTLRHSFTYLFLRLMVEKKLIEKFNIDTNSNLKLGQIISRAFPDNGDILQMRHRIRLTSKKTLINEFNHFEGNLSIFQPAIDITDQALGKERTDLVNFVAEL